MKRKNAGWGTRQPLSGIFIFLILQAYKVARTYSLACWLSFWVALFSRKDLTDFHDFSILQKRKNVWDIDVYLKPHFYKKLKKKTSIWIPYCVYLRRPDRIVWLTLPFSKVTFAVVSLPSSTAKYSTVYPFIWYQSNTERKDLAGLLTSSVWGRH